MSAEDSSTKPAADGSAESDVDDVDQEQSAFSKLMHRMRHIYRTRVRTTTVVLVVVWFALLAFYGFSSQHYDPKPQPGENISKVQSTTDSTTVRPTTTSSEPSTSVEESTPTTTEESTDTQVRRGSQDTVEPTSEATQNPHGGLPGTTEGSAQQSVGATGSSGR
ncbi:hypothetical protein [Gordonia neofelifaecis]|uniref:Uncharacterized protein n=1 Tax=Gordonia neofelifaecis NRRL B-59395 TaxID=644548 RepID=F1YJ67_9ACTN|nr:hypothetical protein [Gordonia neofelifaecis]EGD55282.1 hypothetical protein SCNU_10429 [Gordonia neofelifaecis NRRL B-59395]